MLCFSLFSRRIQTNIVFCLFNIGVHLIQFFFLSNPEAWDIVGAIYQNEIDLFIDYDEIFFFRFKFHKTVSEKLGEKMRLIFVGKALYFHSVDVFKYYNYWCWQWRKENARECVPRNCSACKNQSQVKWWKNYLFDQIMRKLTKEKCDICEISRVKNLEPKDTTSKPKTFAFTVSTIPLWMNEWMNG